MFNNMQLLKTKSIYYDDINLIAQPQNFLSRVRDVNDLWRVMVSPMSSIVGQKFANEALDLGLSVCLHRFYDSIDKRVEVLKSVFVNSKTPNIQTERLWTAIGLKDLDNVQTLVDHGATNLIVDIANGYLTYLPEFVEALIKNSINKNGQTNRLKKLMIGNIHSASMVRTYGELSRKMSIPLYYRVGIASGSVCNTKSMTGYNRGQITEIMECVDAAESYDNLHLVADGGIANPACAAKAFGAGAEMVMMAGYFANSNESQNVLDKKFKFWGGASTYQQVLTNGRATRHSEGKEVSVCPKSTVPLATLVSDLAGGLSSSVSYSGYESLSQFINNGVFELKHSR